jgi:hypothetical protein
MTPAMQKHPKAGQLCESLVMNNDVEKAVFFLD